MSDGAISESDIYDENAIVDRLSENPAELESLLKKVKERIKFYKGELLREEEDKKGNEYVTKAKNPMLGTIQSQFALTLRISTGIS